MGKTIIRTQVSGPLRESLRPEQRSDGAFLQPLRTHRVRQERPAQEFVWYGVRAIKFVHEACSPHFPELLGAFAECNQAVAHMTPKGVRCGCWITPASWNLRNSYSTVVVAV